MVRAKFVCNSYETILQGGGRDRSGNVIPGEECRTLKLTAVMDNSPENKEFFKWTPNGNIMIGVLNQKAWSQFKLGGEYYVDFTPVELFPSDLSGHTVSQK